ncbi:MAG: T9SS type A sorting domain-containing protein [Fibrobacteria bacterium]|nr:T9SS type A sorting domain-containing protein [Fibrobacteria bacterium]
MSSVKMNSIKAGVILAIFSVMVFAELPPAGMVLMNIEKLHNVTSKSPANDYSFSFEELIQWGVNGISMDVYTFAAGSPNKVPVVHQYSQPELIHEAHEYGLWVGGSVGGNKVASMTGSGKSLAWLGADFVELFYALDQDKGCVGYGETFGEAQYQQVKNAIQAASPRGECPVLLTDRNCMATFKNWSSLDGYIQTNFSETHKAYYYPNSAVYKAANPGKFTGAYVWFMAAKFDSLPTPEVPSVYAGIPMGSYSSNADFASLFGPSWNDHKNVILYPFTKKSRGMGWSWGVEWEDRRKTITNYNDRKETIPVWQNFALLGKGAEQSAPDIQVQVQGSYVGMNPETIQCFYAIDSTEQQDTKWIRHDNVVATGTKGTKEWITITAKGVPFNQISENNKIRFKMQDTYEYKYHRNARYWKRDFAVPITALDWTNLSNNGIVENIPADMAIDIQNAGGIDVASVACEFTTDGGDTWTAHDAECTGTAGSTDKETVTVTGVPFVEQVAGKNKIRFSINTTAGDSLRSAEFAVKVHLAPVLSGLDATDNSGDVTVTMNVEDAKGLRVGSQAPALEEESVFLLHLDGDVKDASGNGYDGTLYGDASFKDKASWKTGGATEKMLYLDGDGDFVDFGFKKLGRSKHLTVSAWINAEGNGTAIMFGSHEENGSLNLSVTGSNISVQAYSKARKQSTIKSSDASFTANEWHQVTFVFDGAKGRLYIDGVLKATEDWSTYSIFQTKPLRLGNVINRGTWFKGYIDEFHVISRALTTAEVVANYYSGSYRYSSDSGTTWSAWMPASIDKADGTTESAGLSLANIPFESKADSANQIQVVVRDVPGNVKAQTFYLLQNFTVPVEKIKSNIGDVSINPNPFRFSTQIGFRLLKAEKVDVKIYDMNGKMVRNLYSASLTTGIHNLAWDGLGDNKQELYAGQYFAKIEMGSNVMVKKILMLK